MIFKILYDNYYIIIYKQLTMEHNTKAYEIFQQNMINHLCQSKIPKETYEQEYYDLIQNRYNTQFPKRDFQNDLSFYVDYQINFIASEYGDPEERFIDDPSSYIEENSNYQISLWIHKALISMDNILNKYV